VQHTAEVEHRGGSYFANQRRSEWEFVSEVAFAEASELLDEEERVNVDGVGVIHVLLPEPDESPELRQIGPQQTQLVHRLQRAIHPRGSMENLAEQRGRLGVLAERVIDQVEVLANETLCSGREVDIVVLGHREC
jgi:hypothetical protein